MVQGSQNAAPSQRTGCWRVVMRVAGAKIAVFTLLVCMAPYASGRAGATGLLPTSTVNGSPSKGNRSRLQLQHPISAAMGCCERARKGTNGDQRVARAREHFQRVLKDPGAGEYLEHLARKNPKTLERLHRVARQFLEPLLKRILSEIKETTMPDATARDRLSWLNLAAAQLSRFGTSLPRAAIPDDLHAQALSAFEAVVQGLVADLTRRGENVEGAGPLDSAKPCSDACRYIAQATGIGLATEAFGVLELPTKVRRALGTQLRAVLDDTRLAGVKQGILR